MPLTLGWKLAIQILSKIPVEAKQQRGTLEPLNRNEVSHERRRWLKKSQSNQERNLRIFTLEHITGKREPQNIESPKSGDLWTRTVEY